jgi:hypothetical protein
MKGDIFNIADTYSSSVEKWQKVDNKYQFDNGAYIFWPNVLWCNAIWQNAAAPLSLEWQVSCWNPICSFLQPRAFTIKLLRLLLPLFVCHFSVTSTLV